MSHLSMPPVWVGFALIAMGAAIVAAWIWTAPHRVEGRAHRRQQKRWATMQAKEAAEAFTTRTIAFLPTRSMEERAAATIPAPVLEHTMPDGQSATWQHELKRRLDGDWYTPPPTHSATWPSQPPAITEHAADALTEIIAAVKDPRVSDKAAVMRATAALAGITVVVQPLLAVERWGVTGIEGGDYCRRDRATQKALTP